MKLLNTEEFIEKAIKTHSYKYNYSLVLYKDSRTKVKIKCNECGNIFEQLPSNHLRGQNCKICSIKTNRISQSKSTNQFILDAIKVHSNAFNYLFVKYTNCNSKIKIKCNKCGNIFKQRPNDHLQGYGCLNCGGTRKLSTLEFINKSKKIHDISYDYSFVNYINDRVKVKIKCNKCGDIFKQSPYTHLRGSGCPRCGGSLISTTTDFIHKAIKIHGNKYDYSFVNYINAHIKVKIKCNKCNIIFLQKPNNHLTGRGCSHCAVIISKPEIRFLDYLQLPNDNIHRQVRIGKKRVDGYDPNTNTIYEFLGDYWHGNPKKFDTNKIHPLIKIPYKYLYINTFNRLRQLKSFGYNVKYMWELDWNNFQTGIDKLPNIVLL